MWFKDAVAGLGLLVVFASTFVVMSSLTAVLPHL
jgi:hypothetical protein